VPAATRAAYFPRTPPRKSYSARISSARALERRRTVARGLFPFFITDPFSTAGEPSADESKVVVVLGVNDDQQGGDIVILKPPCGKLARATEHS